MTIHQHNNTPTRHYTNTTIHQHDNIPTWHYASSLVSAVLQNITTLLWILLPHKSHMHAERSVIEDAVKHNSWGKFGCEWKCRFPNTGGLHHTSGDAPLETHTLTHNTSLQPRTNCVCPCHCCRHEQRPPPLFTIDCAAAHYAQGSGYQRTLVELKPFSGWFAEIRCHLL